MSDPLDELAQYLLDQGPGMRTHPDQARVAAQQIVWFVQKSFPALPWRPIAELDEVARRGDEAGFLLLAPELADEDCNVHGVGMGFWQDDGLKWHASQEECDSWPDDRPSGSWMACKWSMQSDEWALACCTPTHYIRLRGAAA